LERQGKKSKDRKSKTNNLAWWQIGKVWQDFVAIGGPCLVEFVATQILIHHDGN